jgi:hypothetical protein
MGSLGAPRYGAGVTIGREIPAAQPAPAQPSPWTAAALGGLVAITFAAAVLRAQSLGAWSWSEREAATWRAITSPLGGDVGASDGANEWAPLVHFLLRWLVESGWLPSHGEGWLRLPFAAAGIAAVPLLAFAARPWFGLRAALLGSALLAVHPLALAASQSMQPAAMVGLLAIAAFAAALPGRRAFAAAALGAAMLAAPAGWLLAAAGAAMRLPARVARRVAPVVAVLAVPCLVLHGDDWSWPIVALAVVGAVGAAAPFAALRVPLGLLVVGFAGADLAGLVEPLDAVIVMPLLVLFAAAGAVDLLFRARGMLPGSPAIARVAAGLPFALAGTWLGVDTFLYATVHHGRRAPWRAAAELVLSARDRGGACTIGADAGLLPLLCYLRPNHWRERGRDAHAAIEVVALAAAAGAAGIERLAATSRPQAFVVLRDDELRALDGTTATAFASRFALVAVVPSPQPHGSDTLHVFTRGPAR